MPGDYLLGIDVLIFIPNGSKTTRINIYQFHFPEK